jgi:hypothetical protein
VFAYALGQPRGGGGNEQKHDAEVRETEDRHRAPGTINERLAAVRRLAYEAADAGLLSPELAAGIRRVKGVKQLDVRVGNGLCADEARRLWQSLEPDPLKGKRDRATLADCRAADRKSTS